MLEPDGVPGFPSPLVPRSPSLFLLAPEGVDREDEEWLEGGLLSPPDWLPPPVLSRWSPLMAMGGLGGSSSFPTSTTRSPSLFSPPSDSCKINKSGMLINLYSHRKYVIGKYKFKSSGCFAYQMIMIYDTNTILLFQSWFLSNHKKIRCANRQQ